MRNKQVLLIGFLVLYLTFSAACAARQGDTIPASRDLLAQLTTEESVLGLSETPAFIHVPTSPTATSTPIPSTDILSPTGIPAPTPSRTETPASQSPDYSGEVSFPFAVGNTWVYSGTIYAGSNPMTIFTATYVVTESVVALQGHPPYTVVQLHREQVPSPISEDDTHWSAEELTVAEDYWYVIEEATVYHLKEEPDWDAIATSVTTDTTEIAFAFPLEIGKRWYLNETMRELYPGFETDSMLRQVVGQGAFETPAETFEQCFQMTEVIGGYTFETWFCPGVGIVARKADHSGTPMGMHELLVR